MHVQPPSQNISEAEVRQRLAADPNNGQLTYALGELLRQRGDFAGAEPVAAMP